MTVPMTEVINELISHCSQKLDRVSATPLLDCQILMSHVTGRNREWLYAHGDESLDEAQQHAFEALVARRLDDEPVAYITGQRDFWDRRFNVTPATLIPRPETELLIDTLLNRFDHLPRAVADLGTGSGVIAVSLAEARPEWRLIATDISEAALEVASDNGGDLENIEWRQTTDWCSTFDFESLDIIVSNPPYIRAGDPHLEHLTHEPLSALTPGVDGLDAIREIVSDGYACLKEDGTLLLEHGYDQQGAVIKLMQDRGFSHIVGFKDLGDVPRAVLAAK